MARRATHGSIDLIWQPLDQASRYYLTRFAWPLFLSLFCVALGIRLICPTQPLVENFIDRQVHTAMMARNLARGGSLWVPQIDIGPFPAYYMLEFPAYPWLAGTLASVFGVELDMMGRLLSATALAAACCLIFDLVRRRDGAKVGLVAFAALAMMPVTIRFGRAFQPDSLMLGSLVASVWAMDRWSGSGKHGYLILAALAVCVALLLKVISAYVLLPIAYFAWRRHGWSFLRRWDLWLALLVAIGPAAAWYVHAWHVAAVSETVSTPFWQSHKWISLDRLTALSTYRQLAFFVGLRVLTPIGVMLMGCGSLLRVRSDCQSPMQRDHLFHIWLASLAAYFPILIRKLDHEHYYLALAPVAAVFIARALIALAESPLERRCYVTGRVAAIVLGFALLASDWMACRSTFRDPIEWRGVGAAAEATRAVTQPGALVAAHSAVLFYADRRGFSFAYGRDEIAYLLSTWSDRQTDPSPIQLLEFYRERGAEYFVELLGTNREQDNAEFFDYVQTHYDVLTLKPGEYLVASLKNGKIR